MAKGKTEQSKQSIVKTNSDLKLSGSLPSNWNSMSESDRSGIIYQS